MLQNIKIIFGFIKDIFIGFKINRGAGPVGGAGDGQITGWFSFFIGLKKDLPFLLNFDGQFFR